MYNELIIDIIEELFKLDDGYGEYNYVIIKLVSIIDFTTLDLDREEFLFYENIYKTSGIEKIDDVTTCVIFSDAIDLLCRNNWRGDLQDSIKSIIYNFELEWSR